MDTKKIIVIVGPTAIGKTALSIKIAEQYKCPIISADSRQFFKEMSIGTAKPTKEEMKDVQHFFIDSHSINEEYNVGKYEKEAINKIEELHKTHNTVVIVGGSGLYINAICDGFDNLPNADNTIRETVKKTLAVNGIEGLQEQLKKLDIEYYNKVDLKNPQRLSRAIEVCLTTGKTYTSLRLGNKKKRNFNTIKIGLELPRQILYDRINRRVDIMLEAGLEKEVRSLIESKTANALQTVGYKELFHYFENKTDFETAVNLIKQNTRRFAKRQITWFKRDENTKWFSPDEISEVLNYLLNYKKGETIN